MTRKIVNIVQWASMVVGITGMSLDKLVQVNPLISRILIVVSFVAFAILVIVQILYRDPNIFNGKPKVDLAWRTLLSSADLSVDVFAGDVSWAQDSKSFMSKRVQSGLAVRVLCRWPSNPVLIKQVRALFEAGVHVRYYSGDLVKIRGLVADMQAGSGGTALTVVKSQKQRMSKGVGKPTGKSMYDYEARRYLASSDMGYISMLHQLFESLWETLPRGVIIDRVKLNPSEILEIISRIPHYGNLGVGDVSIQNVSCASLYACCRTVKVDKLAKISSLLKDYQKFILDPYESCRFESDGKSRLMIPPIVEKQSDGRLVVVDGMHRIYHLVTHTDLQQLSCLVIERAGDLPSDPIPFEDVKMAPTKRPRSENFVNYRHENFRDIKLVDKYLSTVADRYSKK